MFYIFGNQTHGSGSRSAQEYGRGRNLGEAVAGDHGEGAAGEEAGEVDHRLAHYGIAIVLQYNFF